MKSVIFAATVALTSGQLANAESTDLVRLQSAGYDRVHLLQTGIAQMESDQYGAQVDLVGVIHIGDEDYYQALNKILSTYDVVLYELVAPENTVPMRGEKKSDGGILGSYYNILRDSLNLSFQLEHIDYSKPNFVHADLSPQHVFRAPELPVLMQSIRDIMSVLTNGDVQSSSTAQIPEITFDDLIELAANQEFTDALSRYIDAVSRSESIQIPWSQLLDVFQAALKTESISKKTKLFFAEQLTSQLKTSALTRIGLINQRLVEERNQKVVEVLKKVLAQGHRKVAIFYGAAHMDDMASRLESQLDFKQTGRTFWLNAWNF